VILHDYLRKLPRELVMWASDIAGVCWCYERKVEEAQGVHKLG